MSWTEPAASTRSVVICCYTTDRWALLEGAVHSAAAQLGEGDDLVVVVDHNPDLFDRAGDAFSSLAKVVANDELRGLSGARNTGVAHAAGSIVAFLDDDACPEPGWLDELTAPFADEATVGVGGAAEPRWIGGEAPWWMPAEFYWVVGCSYVGLPETIAPIRNPIGCNMAFRRAAITSVGGFSAALGRIDQVPIGGEETDLAIRIRSAGGGTIVYAPAACVLHAVEAPRQRWEYFLRRCYAEGRSKAILAGRVGTMSATHSERAYIGTLVRGSIERLGRTFRSKSLRPLGQVAAMAVGLVVTTAGFAAGFLQRWLSRRGWGNG